MSLNISSINKQPITEEPSTNYGLRYVKYDPEQQIIELNLPHSYRRKNGEELKPLFKARHLQKIAKLCIAKAKLSPVKKIIIKAENRYRSTLVDNFSCFGPGNSLINKTPYSTTLVEVLKKRIKQGLKGEGLDKTSNINVEIEFYENKNPTVATKGETKKHPGLPTFADENKRKILDFRKDNPEPPHWL